MHDVCSEKLNPDPIRTALGTFQSKKCLRAKCFPLPLEHLFHMYSGSNVWSCEIGVTLLRIPRSRILRVMAGLRKACQSSASTSCTPCCGRTGQACVEGRMQRELL